eukprot:2631053-Pyramimonas_sp.AAC.2
MGVTRGVTRGFTGGVTRGVRHLLAFELADGLQRARVPRGGEDVVELLLQSGAVLQRPRENQSQEGCEHMPIVRTNHRRV